MSAALYLAALALFAWRFWSAPFSNENALTGYMAQGLLQGDLPFFFYGQNWMGGYDSFILAPLLALLGPSPWVVNLLSPLCSLAVLVVVHRLLLRVLTPWGAAAGLAFLAVPPASALFWVGYANVHYPLALLFGAVLAWFTCLMYERENWGAILPLAWGLVAGAAFYTNFQSVVFIGPAGLFLLLTRPRAFFTGGVILMLAGSCVGAAPLLYYDFTHDWTHLTQTGSFRSLTIGSHLRALFDNTMPLMLGFNTAVSGGAPEPGILKTGLYLLWLAGFTAGAFRLAFLGAQSRLRPAWLFLGIGIANLAILVGTWYGNRLSTVFMSYLLPFIWLFAPFAWGSLAQSPGRKGRWLAVGLALALIVNNAAAYPAYQRGGYKALTAQSPSRQAERRFMPIVGDFRKAGLRWVYTMLDSTVLGFLANGDPVFSHPWEERHAYNSFLVDTAPDAAFWTQKLESSFQLLGLEYKKTLVAGKSTAHGFKEPAQTQLMLPSGGWQARSLGGQELGNRLGDRVFPTAFRTKGQAKQGQGFVLDLGREQWVGGLSMIPLAFNEMPAGLKVEGADEGGQFSTLRRAGGYWGPVYVSGPHPMMKIRHARLDCYFPAKRLRYLRFTHLGQSNGVWSVAEVLAFGPGGQGEGEGPDWPKAQGHVRSLVSAGAPKMVYADAWAAAVVKLAMGERLRASTANTTMDNFGDRGPDYTQPLVINPGPGNALILRARQAGQAKDALQKAGVGFKRSQAGKMVRLSMLGRSMGGPVTIQSVGSAIDPEGAAGLVQGFKPGRRWGTRRGQKPGDEISLTLDKESQVGWVELNNTDYPGDFPRGLKALASRDGRSWQEVALHFSGPLCFSGQLVLARPHRLNLYRLERPVAARHIRLVCTGSHPAYWWSLQGIRLFGPGEKGGGKAGAAAEPWVDQ